MKRKLLPVIILILFTGFYSNAQEGLAVVDSFKRVLANAKTSEEKISILGPLSMTLMNTNIAESDKYGALMNQEAELSRDRKLIVKALVANGQRYSFFAANKTSLEKSLNYYNRALEVSRKNDLDKETAECLLLLSTLHTSIPDLDKAMNYTNQAHGIVSSLNNDSLKIATYYSFGAVYHLKKERVLALRNYLTALRMAEEIKDPLLMRNCYFILAQFYSDIKEYDKAIDYLRKSSEQLPFVTNMPNKAYTSVVDLFMMGEMYMKKKDFDMSVFFYDSSIRKAEELKYYPLKMPGYRGILRQYIQARQPEKALAYLNSSHDLKKFITNFGNGFIVDNTYGAIYMQLGKYDSARYYFEKSARGFEAVSTPAVKMGFYYQYADFFDKSGQKDSALNYYSRAMAIADDTKDLEWQQMIATELDSVFADLGDLKQSRHFNNLSQLYEDSLKKLGEEKDLLQMELADEEQRQRRIEREKAAALRERHQVQYMGITIGIAVVFLLLILMGAFKVSETTIKIMGFFAFILLFEFIILIADSKIHHWTHGEPLPILGIKIILIAMLLPLHHWLEHKVVSYLASRRLILPDRKSIWRKIVSNRKTTRPEEID